MATNDWTVTTGILGAMACNGIWQAVTIVDATHIDLTGSTLSNAQ